MENMDIQQQKLGELVDRWDNLRNNTEKKGSMPFEEFEAAFSETYGVLKGLVDKKELPKGYLPLILAASRFCNGTRVYDDSKTQAGYVLTERMLCYCVMNSRAFDGGRTVIYDMARRREVEINFSHVDAALGEIVRILEAD